MNQVSQNQVVETQVETPTNVKTQKVSTKRDICGVKLSEKLPNEVIATIEVIKANKGNVNVTFNALFLQFLIEMKKISKSNSNLKTRFRRILSRNLEAILLKNSIQSAKFNLKANIKGIVIKSKDPILFKENGDVVVSSVDDNSFSFKVLKSIETIKEQQITSELLAKVLELKNK